MTSDIILATMFLQQNQEYTINDLFWDKELDFTHTTRKLKYWKIDVSVDYDYPVWVEDKDYNSFFSVHEGCVKRLCRRYDNKGFSILPYIKFEDKV